MTQVNIETKPTKWVENCSILGCSRPAIVTLGLHGWKLPGWGACSSEHSKHIIWWIHDIYPDRGVWTKGVIDYANEAH